MRAASVEASWGRQGRIVAVMGRSWASCFGGSRLGGVLQADVDAVAVGGQALLVGQHADIRGDLRQAFAIDVDQAGALEEVVGAESRGPARRASGGQDVR